MLVYFGNILAELFKAQSQASLEGVSHVLNIMIQTMPFHRLLNTKCAFGSKLSPLKQMTAFLQASKWYHISFEPLVPSQKIVLLFSVVILSFPLHIWTFTYKNLSSQSYYCTLCSIKALTTVSHAYGFFYFKYWILYKGLKKKLYSRLRLLKYKIKH